MTPRDGPRDAIEIADPVEPLHHEPMSGRELRAQSVYRLQIGIFGLCAILLIIGLANIIMDKAKDSEGQTDPIGEVIAQDAPEAKKKGVDPLVDIGAVPASDPTPEVTQTALPEQRLAP
jgi:hypothetical protein